MMERQVDQMVHLVDDLLDVSRISRGSVELRQEAADLAVVLENAIETSSPLIDESRHVLLVTKPPEPVFVHGDVTRLAQVIGNLLSNAAKYTAPGGRIQLEVERVGGEVAICVRDNGVGIRAEDMSRVFEMFTRVAAPADRSRGGLGIGLALVKQIVGLHGGRVEVHSPPRGGDASASSPGSEFIVYLPTFAPLAAPVRREAETVRAPLRPPALRILIADDNVDAAETLTMLLEAMGHETRTTHDGAAALEGAADFRPDVAFLDLGMAGLSGLDVCRRIRAEPWGKGVVVVALTGWGQPEDRQRSADAGFDHHLVKPAPLEALTEILAAVRPAALAQRA
jgi:CheY-like chemotaxis protein/two-component sensor histidine kinase